MKKLLALVAVFALVAFAAPAFAANPFVDVPMNHWAYDAVSHLAAKGIIQGYPDGTYRGNQPMTTVRDVHARSQGIGHRRHGEGQQGRRRDAQETGRRVQRRA
ncbi:S-layer homology domain-containing protein [Acetomicrobium sp.]|uniref:S-layer homology domain-containing protein n=1 Tax=Acetomicrobium sp. TaxID=1872099 RepID=UPI0028718CB6|nr:S-layer homology domain-containing protein [Acetomicrobium sp.]MDR9771011.1 S-layer homology domain-containing protein [Acetomicrobium sp.]